MSCCLFRARGVWVLVIHSTLIPTVDRLHFQGIAAHVVTSCWRLVGYFLTPDESHSRVGQIVCGGGGRESVPLAELKAGYVGKHYESYAREDRSMMRETYVWRLDISASNRPSGVIRQEEYTFRS